MKQSLAVSSFQGRSALYGYRRPINLNDDARASSPHNDTIRPRMLQLVFTGLVQAIRLFLALTSLEHRYPVCGCRNSIWMPSVVGIKFAPLREEVLLPARSSFDYCT